VKIGVACYTPKIMAAVASAMRGVRDMRITWMTSEVDELLDLVVQSPADMVLMCTSFVRRSSPEQLRELCMDLSVPVLVLTDSDTQDAEYLARAMNCGVRGVNVIDYQRFDEGVGQRDLVLTISRFLRGRPKASPEVVVNRQETVSNLVENYLVVIGASSGGPQALQQLLTQFPASTKGSFVVAQHMDREFVPRFATWMEQQTHLQVKLLEEGERLRPGTLYLGDGRGHVVLKKGQTLGYREVVAGESYCPSVNVLFDSVVEHAHLPVCGILLSGMGDDGAKGMLGMRNAGFFTLAQSEKSAAVNGMPKAAVDIGAACKTMAAVDMARVLKQRYEAGDE